MEILYFKLKKNELEKMKLCFVMKWGFFQNSSSVSCDSGEVKLFNNSLKEKKKSIRF